MCGIAGIIDEQRGREDLLGAAHLMASVLRHRGPDDVAVWADPDLPVALGFSRLAILDLSARARQPMISSDGRYVMVFNGEIYNFRTLRRELEDEGVAFRSSSDSEVMLEAIARWGLETALRRANGMFGLAVYDKLRRVCSLARDRLGEKPLYYGQLGTAWVFASELKAVQSLPGFDGRLDAAAVAAYFANGYVPSPETVYASFRALPPGTFVEVHEGEVGTPQRYWSLEAVVEATAEARSRPGPVNDSIARTRDALARSVEMRLVADVPVGVFLSGGTDSSLIAALARRVSTGTVDAFTIGFDEESVDESSGARAVADALGLRHHVTTLTPSAVLEAVPRVAEVFGQPFADPAAIAMFVMSREVRDSATVVLSGDGADEFFGGYPEYRLFQRMGGLRGRVPSWLVAALSEPAVRLLGRGPGPVLSSRRAVLRRLLASSGAEDPSLALFHALDVWTGAERVLRDRRSQPEGSDASWFDGTLTEVERAVLHDQAKRLPDRMLTKVDRASMAWSVEVRTPFLDPDVVAASWSLPHRLKVGRSGPPKAVLRMLLAEELGGAVPSPAKHGFSLPLGAWLRSGLREWADDLLRTGLGDHEELLDVTFIRRAWDAHTGGHMDNRRMLWTVLMFLSWARAQRSVVPPRLAPVTVVSS